MSVGAIEPQLAREFDLEINTGTYDTPVWTGISGITGITPNQTTQRTDDTDFDTDGWEAGSVVQRGRSLQVALNYKENGDGDLDAGYEALIALGDAFGPDGKGDFRYISPNGVGNRFRATVEVQWPGGDKTANAATSATLTMDGAPIPLPLPVPDVVGVVPATGPAAGGTALTIIGTGFYGTPAVEIGGNAATGVVRVNPTQIRCVAPAHAAGAVAVKVTTPGGNDTASGAYTYV